MFETSRRLDKIEERLLELEARKPMMRIYKGNMFSYLLSEEFEIELVIRRIILELGLNLDYDFAHDARIKLTKIEEE